MSAIRPPQSAVPSNQTATSILGRGGTSNPQTPINPLPSLSYQEARLYGKDIQEQEQFINAIKEKIANVQANRAKRALEGKPDAQNYQLDRLKSLEATLAASKEELKQKLSRLTPQQETYVRQSAPKAYHEERLQEYDKPKTEIIEKYDENGKLISKKYIVPEKKPSEYKEGKNTLVQKKQEQLTSQQLYELNNPNRAWGTTNNYGMITSGSTNARDVLEAWKEGARQEDVYSDRALPNRQAFVLERNKQLAKNEKAIGETTTGKIIERNASYGTPSKEQERWEREQRRLKVFPFTIQREEASNEELQRRIDEAEAEAQYWYEVSEGAIPHAGTRSGEAVASIARGAYGFVPQTGAFAKGWIADKQLAYRKGGYSQWLKDYIKKIDEEEARLKAAGRPGTEAPLMLMQMERAVAEGARPETIYGEAAGQMLLTSRIPLVERNREIHIDTANDIRIREFGEAGRKGKAAVYVEMEPVRKTIPYSKGALEKYRGQIASDIQFLGSQKIATAAKKGWNIEATGGVYTIENPFRQTELNPYHKRWEKPSPRYGGPAQKINFVTGQPEIETSGLLKRIANKKAPEQLSLQQALRERERLAQAYQRILHLAKKQSEGAPIIRSQKFLKKFYPKVKWDGIAEVGILYDEEGMPHSINELSYGREATFPEQQWQEIGVPKRPKEKLVRKYDTNIAEIIEKSGGKPEERYTIAQGDRKSSFWPLNEIPEYPSLKKEGRPPTNTKVTRPTLRTAVIERKFTTPKGKKFLYGVETKGRIVHQLFRGEKPPIKSLAKARSADRGWGFKYKENYQYGPWREADGFRYRMKELIGKSLEKGETAVQLKKKGVLGKRTKYVTIKESQIQQGKVSPEAYDQMKVVDYEGKEPRRFTQSTKEVDSNGQKLLQERKEKESPVEYKKSKAVLDVQVESKTKASTEGQRPLPPFSKEKEKTKGKEKEKSKSNEKEKIVGKEKTKDLQRNKERVESKSTQKSESVKRSTQKQEQRQAQVQEQKQILEALLKAASRPIAGKGKEKGGMKRYWSPILFKDGLRFEGGEYERRSDAESAAWEALSNGAADRVEIRQSTNEHPVNEVRTTRSQWTGLAARRSNTAKKINNEIRKNHYVKKKDKKGGKGNWLTLMK